MKINNLVELQIKFDDLTKTEKYLNTVLNEEHSKYWMIRENIKDEIKFLKGICIFEILDEQIVIIYEWEKYLTETRILIRSTQKLINAIKSINKLKTRALLDKKGISAETARQTIFDQSPKSSGAKQ